MTPRERYRQDVATRGFVHDAAQQDVVAHTQRIYDELTRPAAAPVVSWRWWSKAPSTVAVRGLYLWGGVGRGKTYLVDSLFESLPFAEKSRRHFQGFMQDVHGHLKRLPKTPDPLKIVAAQLAREQRVLCLDEFHVDDVADAMLLRGLLEALLAEGMTLLFTSNIRPDALYANGLQRERFIPAIELIKNNTDVVALDGRTDYRQRQVALHESFFIHPIASDEPEKLRALYERFGSYTRASHAPVVVNHRPLPAIAQGDHIAWFTFDTLCASARSYADYLVLVQRFPVMLVSGLRALGAEEDDVANRFIQFIDAVYDRHIRLIASSHAPLDRLYHGAALVEPFRRTQSRLQHLFSSDYQPRVSAARTPL